MEISVCVQLALTVWISVGRIWLDNLLHDWTDKEKGCAPSGQ